MSLDPQTLNPILVQAEIMRFVGLLETATTAVAKRGRAAAEADANYKIAFAQAVLQTEGTVAERDAMATVATQDEYRAKRAAEAVLEAAKEASRNMREQLGALRTVAANLRDLLEHAA